MKYGTVYKSALPDTALYEIFDRMEDDGIFGDVFHDGKVAETPHAFRDFARRRDVHFWAALADGDIKGAFWLRDVDGNGTATMHFTTFHRGQHPITTFRLARHCLNFVFSLKDEGGEPMVKYLYANTPSRNRDAFYFAQMLGFSYQGELPYIGDKATGKTEYMTFGFLKNPFWEEL